MSGSIGSIDYSLLYSSSASDSSDSSDSANTLISLAVLGSTGGTSGADPLIAFQNAEQNETADVAATEQEPSVANAIAAFTAAVSKATSISAALQNPAVQTVLLTANGLADQIGNTALVQQALLSNLNDPNSLANTLADTRWKTVDQTYNFYSNGLSALQTPKAIATLTNAYAEFTWRSSLDATTPGLSNALDFRTRASTITSYAQILGDSTFRAVVTGALGIPPQIAYQDLDAQEQSISSQVSISQFQQPDFVDSIIDRYLLSQQSSASSSSPSLTSLAIQAQGLVV